MFWHPGDYLYSPIPYWITVNESIIPLSFRRGVRQKTPALRAGVLINPSKKA
jgi:hypothetical protein